MRAFAAQLLLGAALGLALVAPATQAAPMLGAPPGGPSVTASRCSAQQLRATYTMVPESNATGHVEYLLTVTNRSASSSCNLAAPLSLRLIGLRGRSLPTDVQLARPGPYVVVLAPGQWAQATSQLSPDLAGPGEPLRGNCEPVAHALRITIGGDALRAPMDPTPVCAHGAMFFDRLAAVAPSPRCPAGSLRASFKRDFPPFDGRVSYTLTLRNKLAQRCHTSSILGLRMLGAGGRRLPTRVDHGISSPYVFPAHALETAAAMLDTKRSGPHGGSCGRLATRLAITPDPGAGTVTTAVRPPLHACGGGVIDLSGLFLNG